MGTVTLPQRGYETKPKVAAREERGGARLPWVLYHNALYPKGVAMQALFGETRIAIPFG